MKIFSIRIVSVIIAAISMIMYSCKKDDEVLTGNSDPLKTALDYINETSTLSTLAAAIERAGLTDALANTESRFTLLAPTNESFSAFLTANGFADLDAVPVEDLRQLLSYHLIQGLNTDEALDVVSDSYVNTIASVDGYSISMYLNNASPDTDNNYVVNGLDIKPSSTNNPTRNAIIHEIDIVIPVPTLTDILDNDSELSSLKAALAATNLTTTVENSMGVTLLSPVNDGFTEFLTANNFTGGLADVDEPGEVAAVREILLNHVLTDVLIAGTDENGYTTSSTLSSIDNMAVNTYFDSGDNVSINGVSTSTVTNIGTSNGIIQKMEKVVDLPSVITFINADADLARLSDAFGTEGGKEVAANLVAANAPFTIFAPNTKAFDSLDSKLKRLKIDLTPSLIAGVLNQHIISGQHITAADLTNGTINTLGTDIVVDANNAELTSSGGVKAKIIETDFRAANGIFHKIDSVLLPKFKNIKLEEDFVGGIKSEVNIIESAGGLALVEVTIDGIPDSIKQESRPVTINAGDIGGARIVLATLNDIPAGKSRSVTLVDMLDNGTQLTYDELIALDSNLTILLSNDASSKILAQGNIDD